MSIQDRNIESDPATPDETTAGDPSFTFDPKTLADAVSTAREDLRTTHPGCFPDQPESCEAVQAADEKIEQVETSLRAMAAVQQPEFGGVLDGSDDAEEEGE